MKVGFKFWCLLDQPLKYTSWHYFAVNVPVITIMKFPRCVRRTTLWSKVIFVCLRIIPLLSHLITGGSSVLDVLKFDKFAM